MLSVSNVICEGETGKFAANAESIGWQGSSGTTKVLPANSVRRAEWSEGRLRLLCELPEGQTEVMKLDNFQASDFDPLWKYLEQNCGVYLKKHKPIAVLEERDFDGALKGIEDAADRVDETAPGSVQKKAKEADLMKKVECVRDGLDQAVSGDKQALSRVFADKGCERIGRLRLVVDTVQLEVYHTDERWKHLLSKCATIESLLKELGAFRHWKPSKDGHSESLLRREMVRELRHRQGEDDDDAAAPWHDEAPEEPRGYVAEPAPAAPAEAPAEESEEEDMANVFHEPTPEAKPAPAPDEEVTDPNAVRADAQDAESSDARDGAGRPLRYTHPNSLLEGWVWKRSRFWKRWRRRWLVLLPEELRSFRSRQAARQRGTQATEVVMKGSVLRVYSGDGEAQQARCFCVGVRERNYYMVCDDENQKRSWMSEIEKALCQR